MLFIGDIIKKARVLFGSKCWKGDWPKFLSGAFERKWKPLKYEFDDKWLLVNNEVPTKMGTYRVSDYSKRALKFFNLKESDFGFGYIYSIAELVCLYLAKDFDYLVWVQGDCVMSQQKDWISRAIKLLKGRISVISPSSDVNTWHKFGLDQYFSDQCFVVKIKEFRQRIYNYPGVIKDFPSHGGNSFEHMVAKYLRANGKFRRILDDVRYEHPCY